jgi:CTP:molybdopterin cytidylyltransferase MocA/HD superfamily phosphodiesterase
MKPSIAAIILAAGLSSRMRRFKPLLPLGNETVIERACTLYRRAGIHDIRVVTGHRAQELEPLLKMLDVRAVANQRYREGMFASVMAGVATVGPEVEAFFVLPVDIPLVRSATVRRLVTAFRAGSRDIVYPCFRGERGHPPLIRAGLAEKILLWNGNDGLKGALAQWEQQACDVEVADSHILADMDTPADYRLLRKRADSLEIPSEVECRSLLGVLGVPEQIVRHGQAVARLSVMLGKAMNRSGAGFDLPLLEAAGLLHDLTRTGSDHARTGARLLQDQGFGAVAALVACHMDLVVNESRPVSAAEVLYLADKLVKEDRPVSLEQRFAARIERHSGEPIILKRIVSRQETALTIKRRLEATLGKSLAEVIGNAP